MPCLSSGSSFCGVLLSGILPLFWYSTIVPWCSSYSAGVPHSIVPCSGVPVLFHRSAGVLCSIVPCSGVLGFIACQVYYIPVSMHGRTLQSGQQNMWIAMAVGFFPLIPSCCTLCQDLIQQTLICQYVYNLRNLNYRDIANYVWSVRNIMAKI